MIRVLQSFATPRPTTNPYLVQLLASLPDDVVADTFTWRRAVTSRYDVLHLHWPEVLLRSPRRSRTLARQLAYALVLGLAGLRGTAVVRTLHNVRPHERGPFMERWLLTQTDAATTRYIRLNPTSAPPTNAPVDTILHGDYAPWFAPFPRVPAETGRLLHFGLVRPYKGVESLLAAFRETNDESLRLHVAGKPTTQELSDALSEAAEQDSRITIDPRYVDDEELVRQISRASLVVLPYAELHNSGALLAALAVGRPVLVPAGEPARALADEVGAGWVRTYEAPLAAADLADAVSAAPAVLAGPPPDLSARAWPQIGRAHADTYRAAMRSRRPGRVP